MSTQPETQRTAGEWVARFLTAKRAAGLTPRTVAFYDAKLKPFVACTGSSTVEAVDADVLRGFLLHLQATGHNPGGVHAHYRAVSAFFHWYELEVEPEGWKNPIAKVKAPRLDDEPLDPAPIGDVLLMASTANVRDRAILLTLLDTGLRAGELVALDLSDFEVATPAISVRKGKGGKSRLVFVGRRCRRALRTYLRARGPQPGPLFLTRSGDRLDYHGLRAIVRRLSALAGVPRPPLHAFRRAFTLSMLRSGADLLTLQRLLGHSDLSVLQRYVKLTSEDLQNSHAAHSPVDTA